MGNEDIVQHPCIGCRVGNASLHRWQFEKSGKALLVDVTGPPVPDDTELMVRAHTSAFLRRAGRRSHA